MRVLFLTNIPSPYRIDFFNELGKTCELTVIFERATALDREDEWLNSQSFSFKAVFLRGFKVGNDSALSFQVLCKIKKNCYDVVIIGGYSTPTGMLAILTMRTKKIPFILNSDGGFIKDDSIYKGGVKRYFISRAAWWLSSGQGTKDYLAHYGAHKERIFIYPFTSLREKDISATPAKHEEKILLRDKLGISGSKVVLCVGQFIHRKGFDTVIDAWAQVPKDFTLIIVGSGPDRIKYENMIADRQLSNIKIVGFQSKQMLKQYYRAADLFLMPTREDIWGLVINEAMAQGLPILTTDKALSAHELVTEGRNGFFISPDNKDRMAQKLGEMLSDIKMLTHMGEQSLSVIRDYTIENMAKVHMDIFNDIVNNAVNNAVNK